MTDRFPPGSTAYTKDGRAYTVDEAEDGVVYCSLPNGTETDFPESALLNEKEWASQSGGQDDVLYGRIKRAKPYAAPAEKLNAQAAEIVLSRAESLTPGVLDFAAFTIATRSLQDSGHGGQELSIKKCRAVFDAHVPEVRVNALAHVLSTQAKILVNIANQGDNLVRALVEKGIAAHGDAFEEFCDRPRN